MAQFPKAYSKYGADMGRRSYGDAPKGKVRLYRVRLDSGGYDDGGAYWGSGRGTEPLYCAEGEAVDGDSYRRFTRAGTCSQAASKLGLLDSQLVWPSRDEILDGMARGPWAYYWAQEQEENGRSFSGVDIYDEAPEPPREAKEWAERLATQFDEKNGKTLPTLFEEAKQTGFSHDAETFGFYLGMRAIGHGISWDDDIPGVTLTIKHPYVEFYL